MKYTRKLFVIRSFSLHHVLVLLCRWDRFLCDRLSDTFDIPYVFISLYKKKTSGLNVIYENDGVQL